jgi:ferredoxin-like protein FixX
VAPRKVVELCGSQHYSQSDTDEILQVDLRKCIKLSFANIFINEKDHSNKKYPCLCDM